VHNVEDTLIKELISVVDGFPTEFSTGVLKSTGESIREFFRQPGMLKLSAPEGAPDSSPAIYRWVNNVRNHFPQGRLRPSTGDGSIFRRVYDTHIV
jgi:hypothetical protein